MLGSTGSVLVISFFVALCTGTRIFCVVSAVLVFGVLVVHRFVEACSNLFKVCGCWIYGTGRIPLLLPVFCQVLMVLACWLLRRRLGILYYLCVDAGHMIQDCI